MANTKRKISTMAELSKTIGISRPTLSRYFQDPGAVRPSTSQKIEERLAGVDYVYNFIATRQNRKSSGLIGVIIPYYNDLFFTSLLNAIEATARDSGYTIISQSCDGSSEAEYEAVMKLRSMNVDGAIVAPLGIDSSDEAFALAGQDFPIVFVDSLPATASSNADFVGTDSKQSVAAIVEYLCRTGDAPVFLGMPHLNSNAIDREKVYLDTMARLGHVGHTIEVRTASHSWQFEAHGFAVMDDHFSRQNHKADTILCANDRLAIGAIRAANKHGLLSRDGEGASRLRIAGHDDHPLSEYMFPALTTVAQDIPSIGQDAVSLLIDRANGAGESTPVRLLKPAALRPRDSA